jgi:hypothetical protein
VPLDLLFPADLAILPLPGVHGVGCCTPEVWPGGALGALARGQAEGCFDRDMRSLLRPSFSGVVTGRVAAYARGVTLWWEGGAC